MINDTIRFKAIGLALAFASGAVAAEEREIFFNGVPVNEHNIQVIEQSYDVEFESGRYWYDRESGLWGTEDGGPGGRIAAGLHIGGPAPEALASGDLGSGPATDAEPASPESGGMTAEALGELVGGVLGLFMLGQMMDTLDEPPHDGYYGDGYYGDGAYSVGPGAYDDGAGNYEYDSGFGSGSQYSDGSWIHSTDGVGSVGGTSDGCVYTSVGGGWSNC